MSKLANDFLRNIFRMVSIFILSDDMHRRKGRGVKHSRGHLVVFYAFVTACHENNFLFCQLFDINFNLFIADARAFQIFNIKGKQR
jgi:hypothetical protein